MISDKEMTLNKERFIELLTSSNRSGVEDLIQYLENTDFFTAPASSRYHNNFKGGLCAHSLNVYDNCLKLANMFFPEEIDELSPHILIVTLLHDLAKIDFYEYSIQNRKQYCEGGKQYDSEGRFNWVQVGTWKTKDAMSRELMFGEHGLNSYMVASRYIKLEESEAAAIINHHLTMDNGRPRVEISEILNRYPLATLLCLADQASAYIDENPYMINE